MSLTVKKWFWPWQLEEERSFLDQKAIEGYHLVQVSIASYTFEERVPKKMIYQMEFRGLGGKITEEEYLQLYEDFGWELVTQYGGWYYFCQEDQEGIDLKMFNDNDSKSKVYMRLMGFLALTGFPMYMNLVIILPRFNPLRFYSIFVLLIALVAIVHFTALVKLFLMYLKLKSNIKE